MKRISAKSIDRLLAREKRVLGLKRNRNPSAHSPRIMKTVEIGHIFKLGYKYSKSMGLSVLDESGKEVTVIMGSYGIGLERILSAAIELYHDANGVSLPASIAPFTVVVTPVNMKDKALRSAAETLYAECNKGRPGCRAG